MKKLIATAAIAAAVLMISATFAVAGGQGESGSKATTATASSGKVSFSFWHLDTADDQKAYWKGLADAYMADHPNVTINTTVLENEAFKNKIATLMQSGDPPDLFRNWGGGVMIEYAKAGLLRDITPFVKGTAWGQSMAPGVIAVYAYDGKQYGMPYDMGAVTFWYNKDMLAKAGYSSFPTTWADYMTMISKLKATGVTPVSLAEGDKWPGMFWWAYLGMRIGGRAAFDDIIAGTGKFTAQPFVDAGQKLVELTKAGAFQEGFLGTKQADGAALVANGKAAMELMGQWGPTTEAQNAVNKVGLGDALGTAPFPAVAGGKGASTDALGGGNGFAVGKNAPDAAVDFLKFITDEKNNAKYASMGYIIPTTKGADSGLTDPKMKLVKSIVDKAGYFQLYLDQYYSPAVGGAINDAVQQIFAQTMTPAQAAASVQHAYEMNQ